VNPSRDLVDVVSDCPHTKDPSMTLTRARHRPEPASPEAADLPDPGADSDIPSFPEVLVAPSPYWSPISSLPISTLFSTETDPAVGEAWDMVDEWGLQSFPASDPPSNW
jgi:hypothetical protein